MERPDAPPNLPPIPHEELAQELVKVCIAEFNDLRTEITARVQAQFLFVTANATVAALIGGLVVRGGNGQRGLLLLLPFLSSALYFIYIDHGLLIMLLGSYIRTRLAPHIRQALSDPQLLGWEDYLARERGRHHGILTTTVLLAALAAFATPSLLGLVSLGANPPSVPGGATFWFLWSLGLVLFLGSIAAQLMQMRQQIALDLEYKDIAREQRLWCARSTPSQDVGLGFATLPSVLVGGLRRMARSRTGHK